MRNPATILALALLSLLIGTQPGWALGDDHPRRGLAIGGECESCDFSDKNLAGAIFIGANFEGSTFANSELGGTTIVESRFTDTEFTHTVLTHSRLSGVTFLRADMSDADFTGSHIERVNFSAAGLQDVNFSDTQMTFTTFIGSSLEDAVFANAVLSQANFFRSQIGDANFRGASLRGANFTETTGSDPSFLDTDLRGSSFENAVLDGVNFTGANLRDVNFSAAIITDITGLSKEAMRGACGDATTRLDGGFELPACSQRHDAVPGNGDSVRFGWRVSRGGDHGTTIRLEADDGRFVELLSGNGAVPNIRGEAFDEETLHGVPAAAIREIARAERDFRRAQMDVAQGEAMARSDRAQARVEAPAEARAEAQDRADDVAQRMEDARRRQRVMFELQGDGEHQIWLTPAPNAPRPPPQPDH